MKRWWRDTLFRRLFLLMVLALMGSHLLSFLVVSRLLMPARWTEPRLEQRPDDFEPGDELPPRFPAPGASRPGGPPPMPVLGSLPPTPGLPGTQPRMVGPGPGGAGPWNASLRWPALWLDYGLRLALMALAAWWGARWLSGPVRRMVEAARGVSDQVSRGQMPAPLDEQLGTVEVREAAQVFNQMSEQLAREFRGRGLLMASISHDLRTPLTRMRIRLESLQPAAQAQRCVDDIREMNALIDGAIDVFRAEDPGAEPLQPTDVFALVQSLADDRQETGQAVGLQGQPLVAQARPLALRRALDNLVGNALRHAGAAEVSVLADPADGGPLIRVDDRGPGIPPAQLPRVLEPFYRLDPSRSRSSGGAGLGLHIARSLLQAQGASLRLSNREGGGLRAEIRLQPVAAPPAPSAAG
jgi:protein-histidine pros-kinase